MAEPRFLPKARLGELIDGLRTRGYAVLGPTAREGGIAFAEVESVADLPIGQRDAQAPGRYRLGAGADGEVFGVVNGAGSLKPSFFAPEEPLLELRRERRGFRVTPLAPQAPQVAILGARACDLAAVAIQDRIFLSERSPEPYYAARRVAAVFIAVHCTRAAATCFCTSMATGPRAERGFDLALTELDDGFVVELGTALGASLIAPLGLEDCDAARRRRGEDLVSACADGMPRRLETSDLPALLYERLEHPRWGEVATRCLSCTNCTMVCPTCFCCAVSDDTAIDGDTTRRVRCWDSCFSHAHAQITGKNFRPTVRDRYRQWLTHKLGSWIDQFGSSGCVGCGRCITACPTGIDLTEELTALRAPVEGGA